MHFKMKTSKETEIILLDLKEYTRYTPNILAQIAIGLSLKNPLNITETNKNTNGIEFNRHTLTGNKDIIFKAAIVQHSGIPLTDEEYFPKYIKMHIDRGASELRNIYNYSGNVEKFIINLSTLITEVLL